MKVSLINNSLCILSDDGSVWAENLGTALECSCESDKIFMNKAAGEWKLAGTVNGWVATCPSAKIYFEHKGKGLVVYTEFTVTDAEIKVTDFIPLSFEYAACIDTAFGSSIHRANGNRTNEMQTQVNTIRLTDGNRYEFSDFVACRNTDGKDFITGFLTAIHCFGTLDVYADGIITLHQFPDNHIFRDGDLITSDRIYITECGNIITELPSYMNMVADEMYSFYGVKKTAEFTVPAGFCTWYYHTHSISGKKVLAALEDIKNNKDKYNLKYFQIDDGWYDWWGNWRVNDKFPGGMKFYADKIKEAGLIPGIWFAPFGASVNSDIYINHPEYFIHDWEPEEGTDGRHLGDWGYYNLDFSVPEVREYIADIVHTFTYDWGFRYIKVDIVTGEIGPYKHRDADFNATRNLIEGFRIIRGAAAEGTFILGCTCPFISVTGLVDGMRVGGDIGGSWDAMKNSFGQVLKRYYYHNILFTNDGDCLIIRKPENEDDGCMIHCVRNDEEIRTFISAMAASGGALMLADKFELLDEEQLRLMSYLFPQNKDAAIPLDLLDSKVPGVLDMGIREKIRTVILINWNEKVHEYSVETGVKHAYSFWDRRYEGITGGTYTTKIAPHECKVMFFTDTESASVIASDSELIPAIQQNFDNGILSVHFNKENEKLTVYAESLRSDNCDVEPAGENLYTISPRSNCPDVTLTV